MIYFDNAATTKVSSKVLEKIIEMMAETYGNPSSLHLLGMKAEQELVEAQKNIAGLLKVKPKEITFNSGGTEANTMAIQGIAKAYIRTGTEFITAKNEHLSVLENFRYLEKQGYKVTYLEEDVNGKINLEELQNAITDKTSLVSLMYVNNETGVIQDIPQIGKLIKSINPKTIFHSDGVQAFGKVKINMQYIDVLTLSAHKIHGAKGAGAMFLKEGTKFQPILYGGSQQQGMRAGTENVPAIAGFAVAAKEMFEDFDNNWLAALKVKEELIKITQEIEDVTINGENTSPYLLNLSFKGVKPEVLLHSLEEEGIFVSTGSACTSKHKKEANNNIRFSFSKYNTVEEAAFCLQVLKTKVVQLRRVMRK